jgi:cobalt transporter subunit CbtB
MAATLPVSAEEPVGAVTQKASRIVQATLAILLGSLVIGTAGISHIDVSAAAHTATRHSNGFIPTVARTMSGLPVDRLFS